VFLAPPFSFSLGPPSQRNSTLPASGGDEEVPRLISDGTPLELRCVAILGPLDVSVLIAARFGQRLCAIETGTPRAATLLCSPRFFSTVSGSRLVLFFRPSFPEVIFEKRCASCTKIARQMDSPCRVRFTSPYSLLFSVSHFARKQGEDCPQRR